jgi:hypothetical protein
MHIYLIRTLGAAFLQNLDLEYILFCISLYANTVQLAGA